MSTPHSNDSASPLETGLIIAAVAERGRRDVYHQQITVDVYMGTFFVPCDGQERFSIISHHFAARNEGGELLGAVSGSVSEIHFFFSFISSYVVHKNHPVLGVDRLIPLFVPPHIESWLEVLGTPYLPMDLQKTG